MYSVKFESYMYRTLVAYMQIANGCRASINRLNTELNPICQ